jgi:alkaline phosphatase
LIASTITVATLTACGGSSSTPPKNVLFFLGDGMGLTTLTAACIYAAGEDGNLTIDTLPESAFVKTYSADAQVTDSAPRWRPT